MITFQGSAQVHYIAFLKCNPQRSMYLCVYPKRSIKYIPVPLLDMFLEEHPKRRSHGGADPTKPSRTLCRVEWQAYGHEAKPRSR